MDNSNLSERNQDNQALFQILQPYMAKYYREKYYLGLVFEQGKRQMLQINVRGIFITLRLVLYR